MSGKKEKGKGRVTPAAAPPPNPFVAKKKMSRGAKLLWGLLVIVGTIGGLSVYVARIPVEPPSATASPFPARFKVTNANWFTLHDLTLMNCRQNYVSFEGGRALESYGGGDIVTINSSQPNKRTLRSDESDFATCWTPAIWGRAVYADIDVIVSYRPFADLAPRVRMPRRFVGRWNVDGKWRWEPRPVDDPHEVPDPASLVSPPPPMAGPTRESAEQQPN